jgi:site-specific DNA-cytosine methylase
MTDEQRVRLSAVKKVNAGDTMREVWDRIHEGKEINMRVESTGRRFVVGRPSFKNVRLDPDRVSPVIAGTNMIHPTEPRHLSIGEMKAFCGYPRDWVLEKGQGHELWNLFTRAVMPPIGNWIGGLVAQALDANKKAKVEANTVDLRKCQIVQTTFGDLT